MQLGADGVFVGSGIFKSDDLRGAGEGDRRGDDALRRPEGARRRLGGPRPADGRHLREPLPRRSGLRPRLVAAHLDGHAAADRGARSPGSLPRARERAAGARRRRLRGPAPGVSLEGLDGLVIPGGESTAMLNLAGLYGLDEADSRDTRGRSWDVCGHDPARPRPPSGSPTSEVDRNAYGRQVRSFEADVMLADDPVPRGVFIQRAAHPSCRRGRRGPREARRRVGPRARRPAPARRVPPEPTDDRRVHERFLGFRAGGATCRGIASEPIKHKKGAGRREARQALLEAVARDHRRGQERAGRTPRANSRFRT